ncbi:hypothetical protein PENTCL1PPCAC_8447 [Pristionchus entomophagus]|uniref:MHD domain-containing protein n=1 Tax=Pristionchus entomophagus TaxID=358040 RepID=A0AAV5STZ5_9BILA|nr:hypothetical protein PENTCL1PPCAC_8447 [Pristionchus entomophagus]
MTGLKYRDEFWGDKHHGYHTLYERFKAGDDAVYELELLIKEHSAMQEDQLRALSKTLGKVTNFASSGTSQMVEAWSLTKGTLELLQEIQTASLRGLQEQSRELARYRADLAHSKKRVKESECVEAVSLMQTTTTCLQKARETYAARCAELEKLRADASASAKEIHKAEQKVSRARDECRAYTDKYEMVRADFEERMEKSADAFEAHDRSHLATLKNTFLAFAACQQEQSAAMLQVHSQFRESLGAISVEGLMERFCSECSTGAERPMHMQFESLEGASSSQPHHQQSLDTVAASSGGGGSLHSDSQSLGSGQQAGGGGGQMQVMDLLTMDDSLPAPVKEEEEEEAEEEGDKGGGERDKKDEKETPLSSSMSASFSASLGGSRQKLAMWLPGKRKKTSSVCSSDVAAVEGTEGVASSSGGGGFLNKFSRSRKSNKSKSDIPGAVAGEVGSGTGFDDTYSTASSSRSEDKPSCLLTHSLEPTEPTVDEEGYTIRSKEEEEAGVPEEAKWASCSSDEDDEDASNSLQQSRIRTLTIKPAESTPKVNASVDELRDAIGSISLARSSTFDKDPWSSTLSSGGRGRSAAPFSQSLGPGAFSLRTPLRAATTGGDEHRAQFSESDFSRSNVPLSFSASLSFGAGMARARPRGTSISQQGGMGSTGHLITPSLTGDGRLQRHTESGSFGSQQQEGWGSQQMLAAEGGGERGFTGSTMNLMQATIAEQRVPIAAALNEYLHVWMMGAGDDRTTRVFGTVLVSFASSSIPLLTDAANDIEPLQLSLVEETEGGGGGVATPIKQIVPNAKLVSPAVAKSDGEDGDEAAAPAAAADSTVQPRHHDFVFDRAALAAWLQQQRQERPTAAFFNAEVLRYELSLGTSITAEPPLVFTAYWKTTLLRDEEEGGAEGAAFSKSNPTGRSHVDLRIDYRLNEECPMMRERPGGSAAVLTAIHFSTKIASPAIVSNVVSEPAAEWDATTETLNWRLGELSLSPASLTSPLVSPPPPSSSSSSVGGSLKARVYLAEGSEAPQPATTNVQFTVSDVSLSLASLVLSPSSDTYHMSMLRRKVMAGKYFCEPQVRI